MRQLLDILELYIAKFRKAGNRMAQTKETENKFQIKESGIWPFGTCKAGQDVTISIPVTEEITKIELYSKVSNKKVGESVIDKNFKHGNIYSFCVPQAVQYNYTLSGEKGSVKDTYAKVVNRGAEFGIQKEVTYGVYDSEYDWEGDIRPKHNYEDSFIYRLHVRGFTKHSSSKVRNKGTFAGIVEKIPYLKELGITAVELMPAYEFDEVIEEGHGAGKINYWGYATAHYFAPKEAYSSKKNGGQVNEFKDMVKELHKAGIEVIMDFYFVPGTNPNMILDCLRHWVLEYHIDGVHVNTEVAPVNMIKEDPVLSMVKIFADAWEAADQFGGRAAIKNKNLAIFNDDFMVNIRRFIKSDEGQTGGVAEKLKRNPANCGIINYLANHYTFTLMDNVSYERKHNEENGENNHDGTDYNYSWNCGMEGITRKKKIKDLRMKQIKNALTILFLSQGTPMIYAGDEMGRSQRGNNNPYCQDNEISWINWNLLKTNQEIFDYVGELVKFRKSHSILHMQEEPKIMDYKSTGIPDMSFHGTDPWRTDFSYGSRQLGVLYNGKYGENEKSVYAAFNMYWEDIDFNIPEVNGRTKWKGIFITETGRNFDNLITDRTIKVPARTIVVLEEDVTEVKKDVSK